VPSASSCECTLEPSGSWKTRLRVGSCSHLLDAPIQMALALANAKELPVNLNWVHCPSEPGAVVSMLSAGLVDMAFMFAEDAVAFAAEGHPLRVCGTFVGTPRTWGIYSRAGGNGPCCGRDVLGSTIGVPDGRGASVAVSVVGDMPDWNTLLFCSRRPFSTIFRAADAMEKDVTRLTIWEQLASRPFVTSGEWELQSTMKGSWPSMLFVASREALYSKAGAIRQFIRFAHTACRNFQETQQSEATAFVLAQYDLLHQEVQEFIESTEWVSDSVVNLPAILQLLGHLKRTGLIPPDCAGDPTRLLAKGLCTAKEPLLPFIASRPVIQQEHDEDFGAGGVMATPVTSSSEEEVDPVPEELHNKPETVSDYAPKHSPVPAG